MIRNSPKTEKTRNPQVFALELALAWLEQNGGQQRIPTALRHLMEATVTALDRGELAPEKDSLTLGELWRLNRGGDGAGPVAALRAREVSQWWSSREAHLRQVCVDQGSEWIPQLVVHPGGGRHHVTRFSIAFKPVGSDPEGTPYATEAPQEVPVPNQGRTPPVSIAYRIDPAKPALWLRLLVGSQPFRINSWRGYVLLGSAVLNFGLIGLLAFFTFLDWARPRPVSTADLASLALTVLVAWGLWVLTRPIRQLPSRRVTSAGAAYLALSELHGQLRAMHDSDRRLGGRVFSVVRHWGLCPICSGEVDLDAGGKAFPSRLVGRCHDAPTEHVFSFDPVSLSGSKLGQA